jgi:hypothetical protein
MSNNPSEMLNMLLAKLQENEAFTDSPDSFMSFLKSSSGTYLEGISFFTPWKVRVLVQMQHEPNTYDFLVRAQSILGGFGYKCNRCADVEDNDETITQKTFTFKAKRPLRLVILKFLDSSNPEKQTQKQIFDISRFSMSWKTGVNASNECAYAFGKRRFSIVGAHFDWDKTQDAMDDMVGIETCGLNLAFQKNDPVWHEMFKEIDVSKIIEKLIQWNTRIKLTQHHTNIPMFLLTMVPTETPTMRNVLYVLYPKDQRYIWNIHWHKLSGSQQRAAMPLVNNTRTTFNDGTSLDTIQQESKFEQTFFSDAPMRLPATCLDIVNAEMEQDLNEYLREDQDHIVFLFPLANEDKPAAACYDRTHLSQAPIFYECQEEDSMNPEDSVRLATSYFRLDVHEFPIYITQDNFGYLLESANQFFIVNETPKKLGFTVSKGVQEGKENMVSADHCQAGSEKTVSVVIGIDSQTVQDAVEMTKGNNKWRKKYPTHASYEEQELGT